MIDSKGSVVIGQQGALNGLTVSVVVPDGGGLGEDPLQDADCYSVGGAAAVLLQVKLALEGVVDGFDDLAQGPEQVRACSRGSPLRASRRSLIPAPAMAASKAVP
jgi:hypothetical protein